jgi:pimeloyl-ACP methyl ester carboxylesterase
VLDVLGIGAADLIGYSMGGMIALTTALRFPERVRRLVVIAAHPFAQDMALYRLAVTAGMAPWLAMVERQGVRLSEDWRRRMFANDIRALQACVWRDRYDTSAALAALQAPLLVIVGTEDPIFGPARTFAERVEARFLALDTRTHITAFLAVGEIVTAVEPFLGNDAEATAPLNQTETE